MQRPSGDPPVARLLTVMEGGLKCVAPFPLRNPDLRCETLLLTYFVTRFVPLWRGWPLQTARLPRLLTFPFVDSIFSLHTLPSEIRGPLRSPNVRDI